MGGAWADRTDPLSKWAAWGCRSPGSAEPKGPWCCVTCVGVGVRAAPQVWWDPEGTALQGGSAGMSCLTQIKPDSWTEKWGPGTRAFPCLWPSGLALPLACRGGFVRTCAHTPVSPAAQPAELLPPSEPRVSAQTRGPEVTSTAGLAWPRGCFCCCGRGGARPAPGQPSGCPESSVNSVWGLPLSGLTCNHRRPVGASRLLQGRGLGKPGQGRPPGSVALPASALLPEVLASPPAPHVCSHLSCRCLLLPLGGECVLG